MTPRRVRKLGELFFFFGGGDPHLRSHSVYFSHDIPAFTKKNFFFFLTVFWQTTLLENRVTCISEAFVSVLMESIWLLERKISRSEYVSSLTFLSFL